jgi:MFS family permease
MSLTAGTERAEGDDQPAGLPAGAAEATWFQLFNALSWQITLGAPAIVYAKSLGASATVLGVMAALTPLLTVFQLPATPLLARYGYKKFLLAGWGSRTVTIFLMAGVPLMTRASDGTRLWTLLGLLAAFNLLRGVASGAWWPWISELIPDRLRGRYLSREQAFIQVGALAAMLVAAVVLGREARAWQYGVLFFISALAQTASLLYIRKIPEAGVEERRKRSGHRVPWKEIVTWPPFLRLVTFNVVYQAAVGGVGVFTVSFMRGKIGFSENTVMVLAAVALVGALSTVAWVGKLLDYEGSRPVMRGCLVGYVLILCAWWAVAAGVLPGAIWVVAVLQLATGVVSANFGVANSRLATLTIPVMGRDHFFAAYSVVTNLAMGLSPIVWGVMLDLIGGTTFATGPLAWDRYAIYFMAAAILSAAALTQTAALAEHTSSSKLASR